MDVVAPAVPPTAPTEAAKPPPAEQVKPAAGEPVKPVPAKKNWEGVLGAQQQLLDAKKKILVLEPDAAKHGELMRLAKESPLKALEALGIDWAAIAREKAREMKLGADPAKPEAPETPAVDSQLTERLTKLEMEQKTAKEDATKAATAQKEQEVARFVASMDSGFAAQKDKFPLIAKFKAGNLVWKRMEKHFTDTGKVVTAEEIAPVIEQEMSEQVEAWKKSNPELVTLLAPPAPAAEPARKDAPSAVRRRPALGAPTVPAAVAKPLPNAHPAEEKKPVAAPSAVRKRAGETFAEFVARKEADRAR